MEKITMHHSSEASSAFWQGFVLPVLRHKRMTYLLVATSVTVTLVIALLIPNRYTSTAVLLPTVNNDQISDLKDMAAGALGDLGLGALKQTSDQSSALYPQILTSRTVEESILKRTFEFNDGGKARSLSLVDYVDQPNIDLQLQALNELIGVNQDRKTGIVYLSVTTEYPELSAAVVHAFLEELNDYNVNKRQSKAQENERFMAKRLAQIEKEMTEAEDSLLAFKQQNRNYESGSDPTLQMELARRERTALLKTEEFSLMTKQHELSKIDAVKDVPVVNILDSGSVPIVKSWPKRSIYLISAFLASLFAGLVLSVWRDLSSKRLITTQLEQTVRSPEVTFNRIETRIINRMAGITGLSEGELILQAREQDKK